MSTHWRLTGRSVFSDEKVCWFPFYAFTQQMLSCTETIWCRWHHHWCLFIARVFLVRGYGALYSCALTTLLRGLRLRWRGGGGAPYTWTLDVTWECAHHGRRSHDALLFQMWFWWYSAVSSLCHELQRRAVCVRLRRREEYVPPSLQSSSLWHPQTLTEPVLMITFGSLRFQMQL